MLLYTLDLGKSEQTIARQAYRAGEPIPDRIRDAPRLRMGLALYLQAFFDLDSERKHDFGFAPIRRRSIIEYADDYALDFEQTADMLYLVREMDNAHISRLQEKHKNS